VPVLTSLSGSDLSVFASLSGTSIFISSAPGNYTKHTLEHDTKHKQTTNMAAQKWWKQCTEELLKTIQGKDCWSIAKVDNGSSGLTTVIQLDFAWGYEWMCCH
jgi:hypothetical protein